MLVMRLMDLARAASGVRLTVLRAFLTDNWTQTTSTDCLVRFGYRGNIDMTWREYHELTKHSAETLQEAAPC